MKISELNTRTLANKGATYKYFHPVTKKDTGVRIVIAGFDGDRAQEFMQQRQVQNILQTQVKAQGEDASEILAAMTMSWSGIEADDGQLLPCSFENAKQLYMNNATMRNEIDRFATNIGNFIGGGSTNSSDSPNSTSDGTSTS